MKRRDFMKYLGGTGLALMCNDVLAAPITSKLAGIGKKNEDKDNTLYKECMRFNASGKFKIVQFTDIHYKSIDVAKSQPALDNMNAILDRENPDLVVYTGDLVWSKGAFNALDVILDIPIKRNLPFAIVWGNHDSEFDQSRTELYDYVQKKKGAIMPKRVSPQSPDYIIPIKAHNSEKIMSLLYCIDSHSGTKVPGVGGYDWIHFDQIAWYQQISKQFTEQNGNEPLPALAFYHIPIQEFEYALADRKNRMFGVKAEGIASPRVNSGFFAAAKESRDIMAMFVGHDHDNDYAVLYKDVMLAYGRYSGGNTVYNDIPNGARIIELYEGERKLDSYIRLRNGEIESQITYPDSFKLRYVNKE